jgi:Delta carbonic anhydrase
MCNPTDSNINDNVDVEKQKGGPVSNDGASATADARFKFWRRTAILLGALAFCLLIAEIVTSVFVVKNHNKAVDARNSVSGERVYVEVVSFPTVRPPNGSNPCEGTNPNSDNIQCVIDGIVKAGEQAATNVTKGYNGKLNTTAVPIKVPYWQAGLCPVNVHWHLGAEHYSVGEFDEFGLGPSEINTRRKLAGKAREGFQCRLYDEKDPKFTTKYEWKHCVEMEVGQTYEVHWPHSAAGACGTLNQYQTPFKDGVFCNANLLTSTSAQIGVQAQVFTIVNDESYYYPDLMRGMIVDSSSQFGADLAMYTGSTTGDKINNTVCSPYAPITWQVDRKCHLVSASTFDKMCADMKAQRDDMSDDLYAHGSRTLVADNLAANNHARSRD